LAAVEGLRFHQAHGVLRDFVGHRVSMIGLE